MIPKIIWQTHESNYKDLPDLYKTNSQTWKDGFPDWEYRYCSAEDRRNFIKEFFPEYLYIYDHIKYGIYKADFWRYLIVYQFGGLYADMDSIYIGDSFEYEKCLVVSTNTVGFPEDQPYANAWFAACPKNEILRYVINELIKKAYSLDFFILEDPGPMWVFATGPAMYSSVINKHAHAVDFLYFPVEHSGPYKHDMDRLTFGV